MTSIIELLAIIIYTHYTLEMCSVSTNGEQASPAQKEAVIFLTYHTAMRGGSCLCRAADDKHANIFKSLPQYQEVVHISVHKCILKYAGS